MHLRKVITALFAAAAMLALILDGQTALTGAAEGMELCIKTVIPSLFPFLFLCSLLTGTLWGSRFSSLDGFCRRLGIPSGAQSILIAAVLGGYPAGAQAVGEAYRQGKLDRGDAEHLLMFCSNAGPAFLFGMTARQFPEAKTAWMLWCIQILCAMLTGMWFATVPPGSSSLPCRNTSISQTLLQTVKTTGILCGWILLFRIMLAFLDKWFFWYLPNVLRILFSGLLELSNGCCMLQEITDEAIRFLLCSVFLSFGGLCVTMQTASVTEGLSLKPYLLGKGVQTALSSVISLLYLHYGWVCIALIGLVFLFFPHSRKKAVDFPQHPVYNADITTGRNQNHAVS